MASFTSFVELVISTPLTLRMASLAACFSPKFHNDPEPVTSISFAVPVVFEVRTSVLYPLDVCTTDAVAPTDCLLICAAMRFSASSIVLPLAPAAVRSISFVPITSFEFASTVNVPEVAKETLPNTCCAAIEVTFTEYVPATALSPAVTVILVVSELVAVFLVKAVRSERAVAASFRVAIFVFNAVKKFL
ncbi:hypothetical protein D3C81_757390 [compost metagenome]